MTSLQDKLVNTNLFSKEDTSILLPALQNMSTSELDDLEDTIDDYNESLSAILNKYKDQILKDIDILKNSDITEDKQFIAEALKTLDSYQSQ